MAESAYDFWKRVDDVRGDVTLDKVAVAAGVHPSSLRNMRSLVRYPKSDACARIADFLGTSVEYLMTGIPKSGQDDAPSPRVRAIMDRLRTASDLELAMVEKILGL